MGARMTNNSTEDVLDVGSPRGRLRHSVRSRRGAALFAAAVLLAGALVAWCVAGPSRHAPSHVRAAVESSPRRIEQPPIHLTVGPGFTVGGSSSTRIAEYSAALVSREDAAVEVRYVGQALPPGISWVGTSTITTIPAHGAAEIALRFRVQSCSPPEAAPALVLQARLAGESTWRSTSVALSDSGPGDTWRAHVVGAVCSGPRTPTS